MVGSSQKILSALWQLAAESPEQPQFLPLAISGVWNWCENVGKAPEADGSRQGIKGPIADLDRMSLQGHMVYITFDSDKRRNASLQTVEREFAQEPNLVTRQSPPNASEEPMGDKE